ncbi:hypothetical protein JVT61DRAFT_8498 [Boletus reticuloceps]|uniref:Uncharacterized protein n=1 Tax=Boletus reticuloceps TaxID=495285 RepID=A0A8I2Z0C3_9AGAM|nr:hypothetical protein JVT61DRAFT_8498 [Boletus reticuloceps]
MIPGYPWPHLSPTTASSATAPTAASRAKANENDVDAATQGKHKRDTLAQVPKNANKPKSTLASKDLKAKGNDLPSAMAKFDGVVIKSRAPPHPPAINFVRVPNEARLFKEQEDHAAQAAASLDAGIDSEPEADLNGDEWDDLDAEDGDDPLMVSEYANEILDYIKNVELATLPNPDYMSSQKEFA